MLRTCAWGLAWVALLGAAPAPALDRSFTLGMSWGDVSYSSGDVDWLDSETKRLQVGYDLGDVPVFFELGLQEAGRSAYAPCPGPVCAGIDYAQDFLPGSSRRGTAPGPIDVRALRSS